MGIMIREINDGLEAVVAGRLGLPGLEDGDGNGRSTVDTDVFHGTVSGAHDWSLLESNVELDLPISLEACESVSINSNKCRTNAIYS